MKWGMVGVLLLLCASLAVAGQTLSGFWNTSIAFDLDEPSFTDALTLTTDLSVSYKIGSWTFTSLSKLDKTGWIDQDFSATGILGGFILTSSLDLDPDATFGSWVTTATVEVAGIRIGTTATLQGNDTFFELDLSGFSGGMTVDVEISLGDDDGICDYPFSGVSILLGLPFCCTELDVGIEFTCLGFDHISFDAQSIPIASLPWLSIDAKLLFSLQTKTLTVSPAFNFGLTACFDFYVSVDHSTPPLTLRDISFDGVRLSCDIGVATFTGISYWGSGSKPAPLTGDYWEVYTIESNDDACCGVFGFSASVFFEQGGLKLFDVSLFAFEISLEISPFVEFELGIETDVTTGPKVWEIGLNIDW